MMRQLPLEPSCQVAFEDLVMNFILDQEEKVKQLKEYMGVIVLDQEEKVKQLEEYMGVIGSDFMQLYLEVIGKSKEEIKMKEIESRRLRRSRGDKRGTDPPIKPHSPDSFKMKVVDGSTINTPPSPHVASFHPKDACCYYHPCIDDPKKHYGFKPCLLGQSGSIGVDFSNM
nr:hypothetical protein [Tanacetum cinerariifolium]